MHVSLKLIPTPVVMALEEFDFARARDVVARLNLESYTKLRYTRLVNRIQRDYERYCQWLAEEFDKPPAEDAPAVQIIHKSDVFKLWDAYDPNQFEPWDDILAKSA